MKGRTGMTLLLSLSLLSCRKYLAKVSSQSLIIPSTVSDYQGLLDNDIIFETSTPGLGPLGVDDYYLSYTNWLSLSAPSSTAYNWQADIFQGQPSSSWNNPYSAIFYCNVVLAGIGDAVIDSGGQAAYNLVWGTALFYRALHCYYLEETFGQPYRPATAVSDPGIPLPLTDNTNQPVTRATVQEVYRQIIHDDSMAIALLPVGIQWANPNRPCRPAAYALLARVYLTMQDSANAERYADSCLNLYSTLVDYNNVDSTEPHPFPLTGNKEVLLACSAYNYPVMYNAMAEVDSDLYRSYAINDLRRAVFFRPAPSGDGGVCFKGNYTGQLYLFSGLAVDEVYLIRAECRARSGNIAGAMNDLNTLLSSRWRSGTFQPYTAATADQALALVLTERRKETLFRELRWSDLRRLNQDQRFAISLIRVLTEHVDTLPPLDDRYTYPIPENEIQLSGILQNQRNP